MKKESHTQGGESRQKADGTATNRRRKRSKKQRMVAKVVAPAIPQNPTSKTDHTLEPTTASVDHMHWRRMIFEAGLAFLILIVLWVVADVFFSKIAIGDSLLSGRTSSAMLEQRIISDATRYRLPIAYPDGHTKLFSLQDIGMRVDPTDTVKAMRKTQLSFRQLLSWWQPVTIKVQTELDAATLKTFITNNVSIVTQPAHDAGLSIMNGAVQLSAATPGTQYGLINPNQAILTAVSILKTTPLHLQPAVLQPNITAPALATAKAQLEAILRQRIIITIGSEKVTPSAIDIANWITLTPSTTTVGLNVNGDNLQHYLDDLAATHTQPPRNEIVLSTNGETLQAGVPGVSIGDTKAAADTITQNLLRGTGTETTLPVQYIAFKAVQAPTNDKWIEVNTTTKRMYAYDQGQLVHSFLISAGASRTPTVTGSFAIYAKYRSQDMSGENVDGSSYFQPAVPYVNYFYNDYAIHGNYWRPASYFGNINSSHGCVGIPVSDGAWIYSWAPVGTPVVIHT